MGLYGNFSDHFTVVSLVSQPLSEREAEVDLSLFWCKPLSFSDRSYA